MSYSWKFHCAVLGVPEQASLREIKHAYRKLALRCHPDRNGGTSQAKEKFLRLNESYRFLMQNFPTRPPPAPEPEHSPPPFSTAHRREEPAPAYRRGTAGRASNRWLREWKRMLSSWWAKAQYFAGGELNLLPYAALGIALSVAAFTYLSRQDKENLPGIEIGTPEVASAPAPLPDSPEAEQKPAAPKKNAKGERLATCELQSITIGQTTARAKVELGEHDCYLLCVGWIDEHITMDSLCRWADEEFRQQRGIPAQVAEDSNAWYRANNKPMSRTPSSGPELTVPRYVFNPAEPPDSPTPPDPETIDIEIGKEHKLKLDFVPTVWVEDQKLLLARHYKNPKEIFFTPIRKGSVSVWLMDGSNQLLRHLIFIIR